MNNNNKSLRKSTEQAVRLMFSLNRAGLKQKEIAEIIGCTQGAVSKILGKKSTPHIPVHDKTADRYEYFRGDCARDSGNLRGDVPLHAFEDPTFDEVAFWEEMEQRELRGE